MGPRRAAGVARPLLYHFLSIGFKTKTKAIAREVAMTRDQLCRTDAPKPSRSRIVSVAMRLEMDAEEVMREVAYVLKLTQQVKREILAEQVEVEATVSR
jgi:hypothetical protein